MIISISASINSGKDLTGQIIQYLINQKETNGKGFGGMTCLEFLEQYKNEQVSTSWQIKKFADKLKDMVCMMLNCTREQLEDRVFKDTPLGEEWDKWKIQEDNGKISWKELYFNTKEEALEYIKEYHRFQQEPELIKMTPRILMQLLGTEAGRNIIHPDLWVICTMSEYNPDSKWIITDNRFPNEVKAVKRRNGLTLRIERDFNLRFPDYQNLEEVHTKDIDLYNQLTHFSETALNNYTEFDYIIQNNGTILDLIKNIEQILIKEHIL